MQRIGSTHYWVSALVAGVILAPTGHVLAVDRPAVPAGARAAAEEYKTVWIESARRNPTFYEVGDSVAVDEVEIQAGVVHSILLESDVARFARSRDADPIEFATRLTYEFPMLVRGVYVGGILVCLRSEADHSVDGDYVFCGLTFPGGALEQAISQYGGFTTDSIRFSVVDFRGDSFTATFLRFDEADDIRFAPVEGEASRLFSDAYRKSVPVPADRALPRIRERILGIPDERLVVTPTVEMALEQASLVVVGTLTDVRRRAVRITLRDFESGEKREFYLDTGRVIWERVLKGELMMNELYVCFESQPSKLRDRMLRRPIEVPDRSAGDGGIWMLSRWGCYGRSFWLCGLQECMIPEGSEDWDRVLDLLGVEPD